MASRSRARGPTSRHAAGTTNDVSRAKAASVNNATAHQRCLRHSTAPHTARAKANASARLARALMIKAGLSPTLIPTHHGAAIFRREPRHGDPGRTDRQQVHAQHGPDRRVTSREDATPTPGTTRAGRGTSVDRHDRRRPACSGRCERSHRTVGRHGRSPATSTGSEKSCSTKLRDALRSPIRNKAVGSPSCDDKQGHGRDGRDEHAHYEHDHIASIRRRPRRSCRRLDGLGHRSMSRWTTLGS